MKSLVTMAAHHRAPRGQLLGVPASWIWPDLETERESASQAEIVTLYPHRSEVPRHLWLDLLTAAGTRVWLYANASLFVAEDNPESIDIIRRKAENGTDVRVLMADPDSPECAKRGVEEQLFDAIPARARMALSYYAPLVGVPGVEFRLQRETLYNSIFVYDEQMLINQHVYGRYGYMARSCTCGGYRAATSSTCTSRASNESGTCHSRSRNPTSGGSGPQPSTTPCMWRRLAHQAGNSLHDCIRIPQIRQNDVSARIAEHSRAVRTGRDSDNVRAAIPPGLNVTRSIPDQDRRFLIKLHAVFSGGSLTGNPDEVSAHLIIGPVAAYLKIKILVKAECRQLSERIPPGIPAENGLDHSRDRLESG